MRAVGLVSCLRHRAQFALFPYTTLFRSLFQNLAHPIGFGEDFDCDMRGVGQVSGLRHCEQDADIGQTIRSEEHTSEHQSLTKLVCRLVLDKKKKPKTRYLTDTAHITNTL